MSSVFAHFANRRLARRAASRLCWTLTFASLWITTAVPISRAQISTGNVEGTVFATNSDGTQSPIPAAKISLRRFDSSRETVAGEQAGYEFSGLTPGVYQADATAPGLSGSNTVTVSPGAAAEASIELQVAPRKESVTVTASTDGASPTEF